MNPSTSNRSTWALYLWNSWQGYSLYVPILVSSNTHQRMANFSTTASFPYPLEPIPLFLKLPVGNLSTAHHQDTWTLSMLILHLVIACLLAVSSMPSSSWIGRPVSIGVLGSNHFITMISYWPSSPFALRLGIWHTSFGVIATRNYSALTFGRSCILNAPPSSPAPLADSRLMAWWNLTGRSW